MAGRSGAGRLLVLIALGALGVAYLFPFAWMLSTSLKPTPELYTQPPTFWPVHPSLDAYQAALVGARHWVLLRNSLGACLATVVLALALALMIAYPLTRLGVPPWFRRGLLSWLLSLRFLPSMVVVIPIFATVRTVGLYDRLTALVLIYTAFSLPFAVWMLKGFLAEVPQEVEEAAFVDGAGRWRAFFQILLPMLSPGLLAAAVITFALSWSEFLYALILTATPRSQTFSIAVWSFVTEFEIIWNQMAAVGVISALVPVGLLLLARRYVISALTFGAVREKA
ncbi:MAG: carbohydrate ABC transporter permease [Bacillati bacterium ANGP1]|uniref:Carbohydrate ABC transporter permease n=1 Tax=Candidatus Segetimicrobium genomatis TaxID=2569760 RepID=A0A537LSS9_9BACT|nr:MAG: carbohydrate ABC transporter permease [Terrabacteria group bacterium ANGP1]